MPEHLAHYPASILELLLSRCKWGNILQFKAGNDDGHELKIQLHSKPATLFQTRCCTYSVQWTYTNESIYDLISLIQIYMRLEFHSNPGAVS
jgi:hypothetical protein